MAHSTSTIHKPYAKQGVPGVAADFDKFALDATPKWAVGTKIETADGSIYRYSHFGDDVNRGVLVSQDVSESSSADTDNAVIAPASAVSVADDRIQPGAIGSRFVQLTLASITVGQFAGGKFITTDDTGEGYTYDVLENTATNDPATGDIRLELAQKLQVALDATTDVILTGSLYSNLEIATTTDSVIAGVTCSVMDVSEQAYGWIQTRGIVGILDDGAPTIGEIVTLSDGTSGAVQVMAGGGTDVTDVVTEPIVGYVIVAGDSGGHGSYKINLE